GLLCVLGVGPELARLLARVRMRMHVSWEDAGASGPRDGRRAASAADGLRGATALALVLACCAALGAAQLAGAGVARARTRPASAAAGVTSRVRAARVERALPEVSYLRGDQYSAGGFGGTRGPAGTTLFTVHAGMGVA